MRRLSMLLALCLLVQLSRSVPVTGEQARISALTFLSEHGLNVPLEEQVLQPSSRMQQQTGDPIYVFNFGTDEGFVIISGDDRTDVVLGYALKGHFDYEQLPPSVRDWIDGYANRIRLLWESDKVAKRPAKVSGVAIGPLLTSHWDQGAPYNALCPDFFQYGKPATGCVATVMAQLLYYHRNGLPGTLQDDIPAYDCDREWSGAGHVHVDGARAGEVIDWNNLVDDYGRSADVTEVQRQAVARLMYYCGAAVRMDYAPSQYGSGANIGSIASAAKKYFGCSTKTRVQARGDMAFDDWEAIIYQELSHGRPVAMSGRNEQAGHSFIIDGYDGQGLYHINWGWSGYYDAYYDISDLVLRGTGSADVEGGFNDDQLIIAGLEPGDGSPYVERLSVLELDLKTDALEQNDAYGVMLDYNFRYANYTTTDFVADCGLALYQDETYVTDVVVELGQPFPVNYWLMCFDTLPVGSGWERGAYHLYPVFKHSGETEWTLCEGAEKLYYTVHVYSDRILFMSGEPPAPYIPENSDDTPDTDTPDNNSDTEVPDSTSVPETPDNPVTSVSEGVAQDGCIRIYDMLGRRVYPNLKGLPKGTYVVRYRDVDSRKIIN